MDGTTARASGQELASSRTAALMKVVVFTAAGVAVAVIALIVVVAQLNSVVVQLRSDLSELRAEVSYIGSVPPDVVMSEPSEPPPPIDLPPHDWTDARRAIAGTYTEVFGGVGTREQRLALIDDGSEDPAPLVDRLDQVKSQGRCVGGMVVVSDIRFFGDDFAQVTFHFEGPELPFGPALLFDGGAIRGEGSWKMTSGSVTQMLSLAESYCGALGE